MLTIQTLLLNTLLILDTTDKKGDNYGFRCNGTNDEIMASFFGFITLVIVLAKMHATIQVLEEKVKVAFQLINKLNDRK